MNKQKKVIIAVLTLVVTMMVGYALFSEALTINGTATAKGDFNLTYTCQELPEGSATGTCEVNGNTITTTSTLTKPTDAMNYGVTITNTGTIPAVLKTVTSPNNVTSADENVAGDEIYLDKTTLLGAFFQGCKLQADGQTCEGTSSDGIGNSALMALNITLQPGEKMSLSILHSWFDSSIFGIKQPVLPETGATMTYNMTLGFEQITN